MQKKNLVLYGLVIVLIILLAWQWSSKADNFRQIDALKKYNYQLSMLGGIGDLNSAHKHADVKVYIDGRAIDFSQRKYQLTSNYLHFEDGIGDVIHLHAEGLTVGHLLNSLSIRFDGRCISLEGMEYCDDARKTVKFYVKGKKLLEMYSYVIRDHDKILISYGPESEAELQKQLGSITNLAPKYSGQNEE